jgi:hypothetical protein
MGLPIVLSMWSLWQKQENDAIFAAAWEGWN